MVVVACLVIMLHAMVPHHHHDCAEQQGFVFENELACHCDCHDEDCHHHTHHPFDTCKLAEMLSHLVLSTKDDDIVVCQPLHQSNHHFLYPSLSVLDLQLMQQTCLPGRQFFHDRRFVPLRGTPCVAVRDLRAPPQFGC